jgi:hypothetical protein
LRKSTTSLISALASSTPATSSNVVFVSFSTYTLALLWPIDINPPIVCCALAAKRRTTSIQMTTKTNAGTTPGEQVGQERARDDARDHDPFFRQALGESRVDARGHELLAPVLEGRFQGAHDVI